MSRSSKAVWTALRDAGLVEGEMPEANAADTPWYVKVVSALSGWFAAVMLLVFFGFALTFLIKSPASALAMGVVLIVAAYVLLRTPKGEFIEHLALALSFAGQAMVMWAINELLHGPDLVVWLLMALLQVLLALVMPNFIHRVFSAFFSAMAFAMVLTLMRMPYLAAGALLLPAAWLWLNEFRFPSRIKVVQAIGYGLVLALLVLEGATALDLGYGYGAYQIVPWVRPWMGELLAAGVMLYVVGHLLRPRGRGLSGRLVVLSLVGAVVIAATSMVATGITIGTVVVLLGFAGSNRVLLGLGVTSLLFYISSYYYMLEVTLLVKAQTLFIVGLVLLAARWLMMRVIADEAKHG